MLANADVADSQEQIFELDLPARHVVLLPLNDAVGNQSGNHWSLLVLCRSQRGSSANCFRAQHYDTVKSPAHQARARLLARRMLGQRPIVEEGPCAKQANGFDCGVYLVMYAEILVKGYLESSSWCQFLMRRSWKDALVRVSPSRAHAYRAMLRALYASRLGETG
eukprot:3840964-Alexandrium_andersonii.AAC.1